MNLNHRVADKNNQSNIDLVLHRIQYPLTLVIPLMVLGLSFFIVWSYFGDTWKVGSFSFVFIPLLGPWFHQILMQYPTLIASIVIIFYGLGPVAFYWFVYKVTRRHFAAVLTGLFTLLPLMPISASAPERLVLALIEGDGAHIIGFTITPLILTLFLDYEREGKHSQLLLFMLLSFIVGLISFFSFFMLSIFLLFISASEILISQGKIKFKRFIITIIILLLLFLAMYNVSLIQMLFSEQGRIAIAVIINLLPMTFFIVPVIGTFSFLIFDRRPVLQPLFLALTFTITFGLLNFVRVFIINGNFINQNRYAAEVSFALAFLVSIIVTWVFDLLRAGEILKKIPPLYNLRTQVAFGMAGLILIILVGSALFIPRSL